MGKWMVLIAEILTEEQRAWLLPPNRSAETSAVLVAREISATHSETISMGPYDDENYRQAEIVCKALNEADNAT